MANSKVDKGVCLVILKRGLRPPQWGDVTPKGEKVFEGQAKDWPGVDDPKCQACFKEKGVPLETKIAVYDQGPDTDGGKKYWILYFLGRS